MAQQRHKIIRKGLALLRDESVSVVTVGIAPTPTGDPPMRIYIIGNDGITLCREPPAAVNEGEIVVASNEELHAAQLSGKRLLALWNALPDIEKRWKVGDRRALTDQLWSAIEALPEPQPEARGPSKQDAVIAMLHRPEGPRAVRPDGALRGQHCDRQRDALSRLSGFMLAGCGSPE
jgi:hypothetical protein